MDQRSIQQELGLSNATWQLWQIVAKFIAPIAVIVVFVTSLMG
jgi:NSS family neurotransmitter:Na+ symporter